MNRVERTALVSVLINVGLVCLKVFLAVLSGSLALIADAWHSGSDVAASGLVWAGARLSRRRSGAYLAVAENIVGLVIAALILWAAFGIFRRVSAVTDAPITNLPLAIGGSLIAALVSYYAAQYKLHVGRETGSISLIADGYHSKTDTLTTGAVIVGLMGHAIGVPLDRIAAVVVAVFIVESGLVIAASAARGLREGTAAHADPFAGIMRSAAVAGLRRGLGNVGLTGFGRGLASVIRDPEARKRAAAAVAVAVLVAWVLSAVSFVGPGRAGVVMRWGRVVGDLRTPGVHLKAPWPIDRMTRVDVAKVRRIEIGFRTREDAQPMSTVAEEFYATLWESRHAAGTYEKRPEEALRLTGDENVVDMNVVVLYTVSDPRAFLFAAAETEDLVRFGVESVMSEVTGTMSNEEMLTVRREPFEGLLAGAAQRLMEDAGLGVNIVGVRLQDLHPPLEVVPAFRDVASAREDKNRIINEALAYMEETVPKARGDAERLLREAEGYRTEREEHARGDAERFLAMAAEYGSARTVTRTRLYLETMEELLAGIEKYIVSSDVELEGYDLRVFDTNLGQGAALGE